MRLRRVFAAAVLALMIAFLTLNGVVFAHHSRAHYGTEESTTKGVVLEYKWRNPHVFVVWAVKDQNGKTTQWVGEMASLTSMIADGMTKDSLKTGDEITVVAFPSRIAGSTEALIKKVTKADGTVVVDNSRTQSPASIGLILWSSIHAIPNHCLDARVGIPGLVTGNRGSREKLRTANDGDSAG